MHEGLGNYTITSYQYEASLARLIARLERLHDEYVSAWEEVSTHVNTDYADYPEMFGTNGPWQHIGDLKHLLADVKAQNSAGEPNEPPF